MNRPEFEEDFEYPYDDYPDDVGETGVGLPPGQLALIIGVNAVISLIISIAVVLIAGRPAGPVEVAGLPTATPAEAVPPTAAGQPTGETAPPVTPVQTVTYIVEPGDTLSLIAEKFSVSLSDLMLANGLTNQDFIQIGQELIIPVGGLPKATPTFTPAPVPTETPLPFEPPTPLPEGAQPPPEPAVTVGPSPTPSPTPIPTSTPPPLDAINVVISEVISPGDLPRETLVIFNQGAGTSLKNWKLEGSPLGVFVFPDIFLFSGGSIRIHTAAGENTPSDLYLNQGEAAWPPGTKIILSDANSIEIATYVVP
ncbi:MAG: LysM peptidoglycan-binding domain-containing protein [Chloroflexi bacterium]|nr:MAG: LysM peptidoglycan-binding domain-containing protein [Chloroflexota bacterium]